MTNLERSQDLHNLMFSGKLLDAFEKYYADNVVMDEPNSGKREGKDANREYEKKFLSMVKEFHDAGVTAIASNEETGKVLIESFMDVTFQDGNRVKMEQVSVQSWKDGQIVHERFYYDRGA